MARSNADQGDKIKGDEPTKAKDEAVEAVEGEPAEYVIPESFAEVTDEDLNALAEQASESFNAVYGDGTNMTDTDLVALSELTTGIESIQEELAARNTKAQERTEAAAALAARVHPEAVAEVEGEPGASGDEQLAASGDTVPLQDADGNTVVDAEGNPIMTDADGNLTDQDGDPITVSSDGSLLDDDGNPVVDPNGTVIKVPAAGSGAAAETVTAAAAPKRKEIRVNLSGLQSRGGAAAPHAARAGEARTIKDVLVASGESQGYNTGAGLDWDDVGRIVDRGLQGFNASSYQSAHDAGRHLHQQFSVCTVRKPFDPDLVIRNSDPEHVASVMARAMDEHRLPKGSLTASGGWCAPSEVIYDLCEMESRDGLFTLPEIGISRGGISFTQGPAFQDIYTDTGFEYTEAEDEGGLYVEGDPNTAGSKPCYTIGCPDFTEERLALAGLCLKAGLLQSRGYPEMIARVTRGALVAHDHKMAGRIIAAVVAGSTAVAMPTPQQGTVAPLLTAIELQVEHMRDTARLARSASLEAVFPFWVLGAIRSDLARQNAFDSKFQVTDAMIKSWFTLRGVNAQFVYNWQGIAATAADAFTSWPTTVQFLLYPAGTWVKGGSDVITLDTIYDSVLLGNNDFTALFSEEGWLVAKMCQDSRVVTAPVCSDGATGAQVAFDCDGTTVASV